MHFTIVSYTFPPSKEIGGRRWAKFSQYLAKLGHEVTVVCTENAAPTEWYEIEFPGIKFSLLPKRYPNWLSGYTKSATEKVLYFVFVRLLSPFTKQNLFDRGFAWKKSMIEALENIHKKNNIDVFVATGAPFSLLYYGAEFKKKYPNIFYVTDFRDPWTWGSYYGIPDLSPRKKRYQELSEYVSVEASDMICYPTEHMGKVLRKKYPVFTSRMYLLPHAYEPDKFLRQAEGKREGFIYGGTLYMGTEEYIKKIGKVLTSNPDSGFKWVIYTGSPYPILDNADFARGRIIKNPLIPEEQLFKEISCSAAYLAIYPVTDKDLVSTKFFEIIYTGTPILYIGEEGEVGKFIRDNKVGLHILPENIEKELPKYLDGDVPFEKGYFDVSQYTFQNVTRDFVKALENYRSN